MKKSLVASIVSTTALLATGLTATPAEAATTGKIYIVVNNSACGFPGAKVKDVQSNVSWGTGSSTVNWEGDGDNIVYQKVSFTKRNSYTINAACYLGSRRTGFRMLTGTFTAKAGATRWVG